MTDRNSPPTMNPRALAWLVLCLLCAGRSVASDIPSAASYRPKNGVMNLKSVVLGGAFRVTSIIPLHGNFAKFNRVDIVRTRSQIGKDAPPALLEKLTEELRGEMDRSGRFASVKVVDTAPLPAEGAAKKAELPDNFREADPLEAPMEGWDDLKSFDEQRRLAARLEEVMPMDATLAVTSEVLDFAKGNKALQLLFLDLGNSILTIRFSYFDEETGEEIGRQIVSSDNSSKVFPSLVTNRTPLIGIAEGLVDQVTRRKVAGEQ